MAIDSLTAAEKQFADWYFEHSGKRSTQEEKTTALSTFMGKEMLHSEMNNLLRRPSFLAYRKQVGKEVERYVRKAREKMIRAMPVMVDMHIKAGKQAYEKRDYRALPAFTVPFLDRAMPKHEDGPRQAQQVVIQLGGTFAKTHAGEFTEPDEMIEVQALPPETPSADPDA
jgi:hypothetical protein